MCLTMDYAAFLPHNLRLWDKILHGKMFGASNMLLPNESFRGAYIKLRYRATGNSTNPRHTNTLYNGKVIQASQ